MAKKDIYCFKKVLKQYKVYHYFKKGLHECIDEYTKDMYYPTWKQIIGKVCLENNDFSISSMIAYLSKEHNIHYTTHDMIRTVINHLINYTLILQRKVTQDKVANEILYEMMKND